MLLASTFVLEAILLSDLEERKLREKVGDYQQSVCVQTVRMLLNSPFMGISSICVE